ncbi:YitT family protein [Plantibacter flavus]|uniref:YitT family protein n=1 Tax=Plantibacter flavus TaxID=150123 RepID=UPI003F162CA0
MTTTPTSTRGAAVRSPLAHGVVEDVFGLLVGVTVVSFGLFLLKAGSAVTGGTAGLSLLISYLAPVPFPVLFFAVNLPFFLLAIRGKGWVFALRSGVAILLVSALSSVHAIFLPVAHVDPLYAAVVGNVLCGVGILILFRHRASLGGFNIVALILQERFGIRAGYVLMIVDTIVVLVSLVAVPPLNVLVSAVGAVLLNLILAFNHKPGRYLGV